MKSLKNLVMLNPVIIVICFITIVSQLLSHTVSYIQIIFLLTFLIKNWIIPLCIGGTTAILVIKYSKKKNWNLTEMLETVLMIFGIFLILIFMVSSIQIREEIFKKIVIKPRYVQLPPLTRVDPQSTVMIQFVFLGIKWIMYYHNYGVIQAIWCITINFLVGFFLSYFIVYFIIIIYKKVERDLFIINFKSLVKRLLKFIIVIWVILVILSAIEGNYSVGFFATMFAKIIFIIDIFTIIMLLLYFIIYK